MENPLDLMRRVVTAARDWAFSRQQLRVVEVLLAFSLTLMAPQLVEAACSSNGSTPGTSSALQWQRWSCSFSVVQGSTSTERKLYAQTKLRVTYTQTSPATGQTYIGYAFWDGGAGTSSSNGTFVARTAFPKSGTWTWSTSCETPTYCSSSTFSRSGSVTVSTAGSGHKLYWNNAGFLHVGPY